MFCLMSFEAFYFCQMNDSSVGAPALGWCLQSIKAAVMYIRRCHLQSARMRCRQRAVRAFISRAHSESRRRILPESFEPLTHLIDGCGASCAIPAGHGVSSALPRNTASSSPWLLRRRWAAESSNVRVVIWSAAILPPLSPAADRFRAKMLMPPEE